jgi:hypothetical protein
MSNPSTEKEIKSKSINFNYINEKRCSVNIPQHWLRGGGRCKMLVFHLNGVIIFIWSQQVLPVILGYPSLASLK